MGCQQAPPTVNLSGASTEAQNVREGRPGTYRNKLTINAGPLGTVDTCADPDIVRGQQPGDRQWYLYCTTDPLNAGDRDANGNFNFRLITMAKSTDLVNWTYVGDAFSQRPSWVWPDAGMWAPEVAYLNGKYFLYYTASDTVRGGSAIGVATSDSPTGPWVDSGGPVVEPQRPPVGDPNARRWVFDADVIQDTSGQNWIYYGSYFGGVAVRKLSADGLRSDPATQKEIASANRYEGSNVFQKDGWYYLFASATDCCRGPLTGYSVFVGRSRSPDGPFLDRDGVDLSATYVGGTPMLSMNGNRWVGPGHNAVFTDASGQDWTVYHAIDRFDPYLAQPGGLNKRPALLDPIDWESGWPTVRGGLGASDEVMPAPAAQPGQRSAYRTPKEKVAQPGKLLAAFSDEFNGTTLDGAWTWIRPPAPSAASLEGGVLRFDTQNADLFGDINNASVLTRPVPQGDYLVEVKLSVNLPGSGCCFNFRQAGLVIYGNDDNFVKLTQASIWDTRQIEFAKEQGPVAPGFPRYGNTVLSAAAPDAIWLRIARTTENGEELYTASTSRNGTTWTRGSTWTHQLDANARIGLVSMGGPDFTARFDYVRVYNVKEKFPK
ncbi:family 43 glycosylhydrolase [Deinococcus hopiensis]|uniref:family 43 glycosylhydrolase n=1 Tax=Deinococcus hopiensis TaxID=309885 RepID=UPI001FEAC28A|nr:family 43 glycosylhydrolase [Deinococcus hopiensis]